MSKRPEKIFLKLQIPRSNDRGPMAFEQILASLHGLFSKEAKKTGDETIAFEIVNLQGYIHFYIIAPKHLRTLISSQVFSQYPEVEITEDKEYFTKSLIKDKKILTCDIKPAEPWVYPIKRYPQFEDKLNQCFEDPIGPMTAAISHLHHPTDSAIIQFTVQPISQDWNAVARMNLRRFFGSGIWQVDRFRFWYQAQRLPFTKGKRLKNAWKWWPTLLLTGWIKSKELADSEDQKFDKDEQTSGQHDKETVFTACYDKLSRLNFATNIRACYIHSDPDDLHAEAKMREVGGTFQQFAQTQMNSLKIGSLERETAGDLFKNVVRRNPHLPFALSQEELATVFHLPTETVKTAGIRWTDYKKLEPPSNLPVIPERGITLLGTTNFRSVRHTYGMRPLDRQRHVYVIGKTGMGKSTLLENMIYSDIMAGKGVGVIDPHGDLAEAAIKFLPKHRTNDVMIFDPSDRDWPIAFNMLEGKNQEQRALIASGLVGVIKKLNADSWGPRLEHFLRNTILALVEAPDTTMLGITRILVDKHYREKVLNYVTDPMVRSFWETEFNALPPSKLAEAIGPIQNKVGQFLATPIIRNIVGQPKSTLDLRMAMDSGKVVIVNLSKGKIGEDNATMLGSMLITKFQIDAMSRADVAESERRPFMLYVDEFQNFATDSFATILSEARKYKLSLTMANQYISQMSEEVAAAVFGNVGSLVSFQVGIDDAKILSEQFDEERVLPIDLVGLPKYSVYNRIMVDGLTSTAFSAATLPPPKIELDPEVTPQQHFDKVVQFARQRYARPREVVEDKINRWTRTEQQKKQIQRERTKEQKGGDKKGGQKKSD